MDSSMGGAAGFGGRDIYNSLKGKRPSYKRLSSTQTTKLEKFIRDCPHPDENQRCQLAAEIGLEPKQIKFWFQNKRTQMKNQHERADNTALRVENDRIRNENRLIKDTLKNLLCPSCGGPPCREEEHDQFMQRMQLENDSLRLEHEKVSNFLARYLERQMSQPELRALLPPITGSSSYVPEFGSSLKQSIDEVPSLDQNFGSSFLNDDMLLHNPTMGNAADMEKALMLEVATTAMDELVRLMHIYEPLWVKSSAREGKFILNREEYEKTFPRTNHFKGAYVRVESSKGSALVSMSGMELVDMFLDSDKWVNLFPAIVTKAETIHVVETGLSENRSGTLQLMYEKMHTLSPLVPSREFRFLRYCQQVGVGEWVITDVSFDPFGDNNNTVSRCWRHPSGCIIQEMPNGYSMVTWIEHVEVDDKTQTHRLYRDIVTSSIAYGAERWITELQRMCERFVLYAVERIPNYDVGGVINSLEGRRSMMNLSHRMVKMFCKNLNISDKLDFPHLNVEQNSGVRVSIRRCTEPGQPHGMVVIAATSIWLPLPYQHVFEFLTDERERLQWDIISCGNPVHKIAHISNGSHPGSCTSVIQPFIPTENNALILQESFMDPMGSYVVYAPADVTVMNLAIRGEDSTMIPILPSGFVISGDGKSNVVFGASNEISGGSLLTVALQILVCTLSGFGKLDVETVSTVNTILTSTVEKIKDALNCNSLE